MDFGSAVKILSGKKSSEQSINETPATSKVITATVVSKSENGSVRVALDGQVFNEDDSQYIELDTVGGLEEGDTVNILLTGNSGYGLTPFAIGSVGSIDRLSERVTIAQEAGDIALATNQHFWTDTSGAHVTDDTSDAWNTEYAKDNHGQLSNPTDNDPWHNILLNSLGILLRRGLLNLTSISKSAIAFYDGTGNSSDNITASFGGNGAIIGKTSGRHVVVGVDGLSVYNSDGSLAPVNSTFDGKNIDGGSISGSKINFSTFEDGVISGSAIDTSTFKNGTISGSVIDTSTFEDGTISGSVIDTSKFKNGTISGSVIDTSKFENGTIEGSVIRASTLTGIPFAAIDQLETRVANIADVQIGNATIKQAQVENLSSDYAHVQNGVIDNAKIGYADVNGLNANYAHVQNGVIDNAKIGYADVNGLNANYAHVQNGVIDNAKIGYADVNDLNAHYASIDMANVNNSWITNGTIARAAIKSEMVESISANQLTAGEIDADEITVRNLKASSLTVQTADGYVYVGEKRIPTKEFIDSLRDQLQDEIDGAIETFTVSAIPTLSNTPANDWVVSGDTEATKKLRMKHVGDIAYVVNSASAQNGYCYRFAYDTTNQEFKWVLIKDSDVTAALSRLSNAEGKITGLETFESNTTSWINETDDGLETIRTNHTNLSGVVDKTVTETKQLWFTKANTTAPNKPTAAVTSTSTDGNAWRVVVPAWNASYPNYFYCLQYKLADGTYAWSDVVRDIAMGESQQQGRKGVADAATADGKAVSAQNTANANIKSSVQLWFTKANTTAPGKPSSQVTLNDASKTNQWNLAIPTYNSSYPYYFYCYQQQKGDNTYQWTDVVYDRSISEAQEKAQAALPSSTFTTFRTTTFKDLVDTVDEQSSTITTMSERVDKIQIGGRNLLRGAATQDTNLGNERNSVTETTDTWLGCTVFKSSSAWADIGFRFDTQVAKRNLVVAGDTLTYSVWAKTDDTTSREIWGIWIGNANGGAHITGAKIDTLTNSWKRYEKQITVTQAMLDNATIGTSTRFECNTNCTSGKFIYWAAPKLEKGTKATDWSPAPEDVDASIKVVSNTVNSVKQTADSNSMHLTNLTTTLGTNADGTSKSEDIVHKYNTLDQTLEGTVSRVGKTEASLKTVSNPNLTPWFSHPMSDIWDAATNPDGYWSGNSTTWTRPFVAIGDGWAHIDMNNSSGSGTVGYYASGDCNLDWMEVGKQYTVMLEGRNCTGEVANIYASTGATDTYLPSTLTDLKSEFDKGSFVSLKTLTAKQPSGTDVAFRIANFRIQVAAGKTASGDFRFSIYEGEYTGPYKPYVDQSLTNRVMQAETSIEQNATDIALRATKTEAYQLAQSNLSPFFDSVPYRTATSYDGGYWQPTSDNWFMNGATKLSDGWAHITRGSSTGFEIAIPRIESLTAGDKATLMIEWRNVTVTGVPVLYSRNYPENCQFANNSYRVEWADTYPSSGLKRIIMTVNSTADNDANWNAAINLGMYNSSEISFEGDLRLSIYEGEYSGPYKPYSGPHLYASQSELKITADGINSTVSKVSGYKYCETNYRYSLSSIKTYSTDGYSGSWTVLQDYNLRVGDTVYLKIYDVTRECDVYIKGTITSMSSATRITITSHGYEDVLPVNTIKSTINQSSDSVKIKANHVEIDGTTTFTSGTTLANYVSGVANTAVDGVEVGGRNLLPGTEKLKGFVTNASEITIVDGVATLPGSSSGWAYLHTPNILFSAVDGNDITFSFEYKADKATYGYICTEGTAENNHARSRYKDHTFNWPAQSEWTKWSVTFKGMSLTYLSQGSGNVNYFHLAMYSRTDSSNFKVRFPKLEKGTKATDWTPSVEDQTDYVDKSIDGIQVGGRNLYKSTTPSAKVGSGDATISAYDFAYHGRTVTVTSGSPGVRLSNVIPETNVPYTISFTCTASVACSIQIDVMDNAVQYFNVPAGTSKVVCTSTPYRAVDSIYHFVDILFSVAGTYKLADIMVEQSNKASSWSLAPEDAAIERTCTVGQNSSTTTNPWYRIASSLINTQFVDNVLILDVYDSGGYSTGGVLGGKRGGRLSAHIRASQGITTAETPYLIWESRGSEINLSDFVLAYKVTSGSRIDAEIWCRCPQAYQGYVFKVVYEGHRSVEPSPGLWVLYSSWSAGSSASITSGYTQVVSTDGSAAQETANANVKRTQRIYYRKATVGAPSSVPTAWVTNGSVESSWTKYNAWSTRVPPIADSTSSTTKYLYLYTCEQYETAGSTTPQYTTVLLDDSTTIIDGGTIITGSIAANKLTVYDATIQKIRADAIDTKSIFIGDLTGTIGGRNLLHGTRTMTAGDGRWDTTRTFRASGGTLSNVTTSGLPIRGVTGALRITNAESSTVSQIGFAQDRVEGLITGETYTQGAWVRASTTMNIRHQPIWKSSSQGLNGTFVSVGTAWQYISFTGELTGTQATDFYSAGYMYAQNPPAGAWFEVCGLKLEKGSKETDWTPAPEDVDSAIEQSIAGQGGFDILWNRVAYDSDENAGGECYVCAYEPTTAIRSNANGWVMWNGAKRTIPRGGINPNNIVPYNIPVYLVCRLSDATSTTGTMYMVWYNSGWKYAVTPTPTAVGGTWTWAEATDMVIGKFVEPGAEVAFTECETYRQPLKWGAITTDTVTARSAQLTANTAIKRSQRIYYRTSSDQKPTNDSMPTGWVTVNVNKWSSTNTSVNNWTTKVTPISDGTGADVNKCLYLWTCIQYQLADNSAIKYSEVLLDDSTTVIDGGKIITGSIAANTIKATVIDAVNEGTGTIRGDKINASQISIGSLNGASTVINNASNGASALTKVNYFNRYAFVKQSTTLNISKPWYKFASASITSQNTDRLIAFNVQSDMYGTTKSGILIAHIRAGANIGRVEYNDIHWVNRSQSINPAKFIMAYKLTSGTSLLCELWCKLDELGWHGLMFNQIYESGTASSPHWTLYNTVSAGSEAAITSGYTQVTSVDKDSAATTATNYITDITSGGMMVHPSNDANTGVLITDKIDIKTASKVMNRIDTSGMTLYDGSGVADSNIVAKFASSLIELGKNSRNAVINMCNDVFSIAFKQSTEAAGFTHGLISSPFAIRVRSGTENSERQVYGSLEARSDQSVPRAYLQSRYNIVSEGSEQYAQAYVTSQETGSSAGFTTKNAFMYIRDSVGFNLTTGAGNGKLTFSDSGELNIESGFLTIGGSIKAIYSGSVVETLSNGKWLSLANATTVTNNLGSGVSQANTICIAQNGDFNTYDGVVTGAMGQDGSARAYLYPNRTGIIRINFILIRFK